MITNLRMELFEALVDRSVLTAGFYSGTSMSPQEYIYTNVGT